MESTRAIGYSIEAAVADIIDNSISAHATEIGIWFLPFDEPYVAILDNGYGMDPNNLTEAMRYGSYNPNDDRKEDDMGRYGLGMKTASLSQCRCLTVVTKSQNKLYARRWDLDFIAKSTKWTLLELNEQEILALPVIDKLREYESGTLVIWSQLDKVMAGEITLEQALDNRMKEVRDHLELVFHRYLSGDTTRRISMSVNDNPLIPFDPFFTTKSTLVMDDEKIEVPGRIGKVVVRPYILPHPSKMTKFELQKYGGKDGLKRLQGFYIYRNKRLLSWGTWFRLIRMDEFSKLARVRVDIPNSLDDLWTLDVKKSTANPPEIVKTRLRQIIGTISNSSKKTWTFRHRKETDDNISHIWSRVDTREGVRYLINPDHPLLDLLNSRVDNTTQKILSQYLDTIQNNLPLNTLHNDIYNEAKIAQDQESVERKRVYEMAQTLLQHAKNNGDIETVYSNFESVEPFNEYMDEIKTIYLEVNSDG